MWDTAVAVGVIGVQMHDMYALPVARGAFPAQRITLPGALVKRCTAIQDALIKICMTLGRRHKPDRAVTMLVVVPLHQFGDPVAGRSQGVERFERIGRPVFQCFE